MGWKLYDFIDSQGRNLYREWLDGLPTQVQAKVEAKLDALMDADIGVLPNMITDTKQRSIRELVINGKSGAYRLFICRGPKDMRNELTLLCGGQEKDRKYIVNNPSDAERYRQELLGNEDRRIEHE